MRLLRPHPAHLHSPRNRVAASSLSLSSEHNSDELGGLLRTPRTEVKRRTKARPTSLLPFSARPPTPPLCACPRPRNSTATSPETLCAHKRRKRRAGARGTMRQRCLSCPTACSCTAPLDRHRVPTVPLGLNSDEPGGSSHTRRTTAESRCTRAGATLAIAVA